MPAPGVLQAHVRLLSILAKNPETAVTEALGPWNRDAGCMGWQEFLLGKRILNICCYLDVDHRKEKRVKTAEKHKEHGV